jgi:hypothetical protein
MITLKNIIQFQNSKVLFFILLCFQFSFANSIGFKGDSLTAKYPINDPRNPNCECHKYQKLADDEFEKLFGKSVVINADKNNTNYTNTLTGNTTDYSKKKIVIKKSRSKNVFLNVFSFNKKKQTRRKKIRGPRRDNTSCYHF